MIDLDTVKIGDTLTFTDGGLSDTGTVVSINHDENTVIIAIPTSGGFDRAEIAADEPGLTTKE